MLQAHVFIGKLTRKLEAELALRLDFNRIREHRGAQSGGFEELCCQLASLEDPAEGSRFVRKGTGADQGLECYRTYADDHEVGWQAKFFQNGFDTGQVADVKDSLKRALAAHPRLTKFILCMPFDLRDNRSGRKLSEVQRYEKWCTESIKAAATQGRSLEIEIWSASNITERLGRDTPAYSGRARYWFDTVSFGPSWFREKFEVQRHNLGERYSQESHVDLPIQQALHSLARDPDLLTAPADWMASIMYKLDGVVRSLTQLSLPLTVNQLRQSVEPLLQSLSESCVALEAPVPVDAWSTLMAAAVQTVAAALAELRSKGSDEHHTLRRELFELYSAVDHGRQELASMQWRLVNKRALVIVGPAGIGKSHLLGEFGNKQLDRDRPFILVLTGTLNESDPWEQIRAQLDLVRVTTYEFLGALDAAAEAAGCRAVLAIDALNEKHGIALWETRLKGFVALVQMFPRIAIVLTVRQTYAHYLPLDGLEHVVHPGFAGQSGNAAMAYLDRRGIARPSSPNLAREFENPLFLRTCCAYLDAESLKQLPKGLDGITAIFDFYLAAVARKVDNDLKLVPQQKIARRALDGFLDDCAALGDRGTLPIEAAIDHFEQFLPSGGSRDRSLLTAFLSEGVLTQEIDWQDSSTVDVIRFTFERLSDHLRAKRLIAQIDRVDPVGSFRREPLASYFGADASWEVAGVVEALAVQLPEEFGLELLDVLPSESVEYDSIINAFESSLAWRAPKAFTEGTLGWVVKLADLTGRSAYNALLLVCTEPENQFNAEYLHRKLWALPMPQRDADWSVFLAKDDLSDGGPVESLIDWAWQVDTVDTDDTEAKRFWLSAIALTWCLTTSNRAVRDRATKALVNLLSSQLLQAAALLDKFAAIDDSYISERLLAACYGAVMQGKTRAACSSLALSVWNNYFAADRQPPAHFLARDYALGILLYVQAIGELPSAVDVEACKQKFKSAWPLEPVTDAQLQEFHANGYGDSIASSTEAHGDFGNYTLRGWLHDIAALPRTLAGQTTHQLFKAWEHSFQADATTAQLDAYATLLQCCLDYRRRSDHGFFSDKGREDSERLWAAMVQANKTFQEQLPNEALSEYGQFPEQHLLEATRMADDGRRPPEVDHEMVRRWICVRAHKLGWSETLFEVFDEGPSVTRERMGSHRVERVGKKYQRIALAEVTTRLTDNLSMCSYENEGKLRAFEYNPDSFDMKRDIDPSLLVRKTFETGWASTPLTWWTPNAPKLPSGNTDVLLAWLRLEDDLCNTVADIEVTSADRNSWLVVHGFRQWTVPGQSRRNHADAWSRITCLLTNRGSAAELGRELLGRQRGDSSQMSNDHRLECFLGEHGWRDEGDLELFPNTYAGIKTPFANVVQSLTAEGNTKDNSIDETFSLQVPSAGVLKALGLKLRSGRNPEYVDAAGRLRWQDPSLRMRGAGAGIAARDFFLSGLERAGLEPVWVLAGEKNVYSGRSLGGTSGFGGCLYHTTVFTLDAGDLKAVGHASRFHEPSADQLKALYAGE